MSELVAVLYKHGKDDYGIWQLDVPENVLTKIEKLLEPYSHRGCSVRGTLNDILKDYQK